MIQRGQNHITLPFHFCFISFFILTICLLKFAFKKIKELLIGSCYIVDCYCCCYYYSSPLHPFLSSFSSFLSFCFFSGLVVVVVCKSTWPFTTLIIRTSEKNTHCGMEPRTLGFVHLHTLAHTASIHPTIQPSVLSILIDIRTYVRTSYMYM